jgi:hypothetical protein
VLDDIQRRGFLVQPAGEDAAPALVGLLHVDLDEGAGQLLLFPRRCRFAGAKPHDHVLPANRLARVKRDVLDDAVALVEDSQHGDALRHRRHSALTVGCRRDLLAGRKRRVRRLAALAARSERESQQQRCDAAFHAYSGIHGS